MQYFFIFMKSKNGSVLVLVLWILILISFLAGQYLAYNREKSDIAKNAWTAFRQQQAVASMIQLFSVDSWPIPDGKGIDGQWFRLFPDDLDVWVRVSNEESRINLNTANDGEIKIIISNKMGDDRKLEADAVSDAILDWRDVDNMARLNGAEENDYKAKGLTYRPANGLFNVLSELLLVMNVTSDLFWGDPVQIIERDINDRFLKHENNKYKEGMLQICLSDIFTIQSEKGRRISLLVPGNKKGYLYTNIIIAKGTRGLEVADSHQMIMAAEHGLERLAELEEEVNLIEGNKRKRP